MLLLLCPTWGLQQVAIKAAAVDVAPVLQVTLRSGVAALLVLLLSRIARREPWLYGRVRLPGLVIGILFAAEFLFVAEGLRWTSAAHMAMFLYTAPVFTAIGLHCCLPEERLSRLQWGGVLLAFLGVGVTFLQPSGQTPQAPMQALGDVLGLCAGAAWGARTTVVRSSGLSEAPPTQTLFYQLTVATVIMAGFTLGTGQVRFHSSGIAWASLGFQIFAVSFAAYLAWFWMLRRYFAARLSVLTFMTPLFGMAMGAVLLGEHLSASFLLGALLVLLGVVIVNADRWVLSLFTRHASTRQPQA